MTIIHRIVSGSWKENGYVIHDEACQALVIDPGGQSNAFKTLIAEVGLTPHAILNTHAHYDHLGSVVDLMEEYSIPFYLHGADRALLRQANLYKLLFGQTANIRVPTTFCNLVEFGSMLKICNFDVEIIPTPGHTKGSTCFRIDDALFSGDTLLPGGPGRVDLPGGSAGDMALSLGRIAHLAGTLMMYPGHGDQVPLAQALAKLHARSSRA